MANKNSTFYHIVQVFIRLVRPHPFCGCIGAAAARLLAFVTKSGEGGEEPGLVLEAAQVE